LPRRIRENSGQVNQYAADLHTGQTEELADRPGRLQAQRSGQPDQGALQHIVGLLLESNPGKSRQHAPSKVFEPFLRTADERVQCRVITGPEAGDQLVQSGCAQRVHRVAARGSQEMARLYQGAATLAGTKCASRLPENWPRDLGLQGEDGRDHNPFGFTVWLALTRRKINAEIHNGDVQETARTLDPPLN
jgi:hypothetical protein